MLFHHVDDADPLQNVEFWYRLAKPIKDVEFWYRLVVDQKQRKAQVQLRINPKCYSHDLSYLLRLAAELKKKMREVPLLRHEIDDQMIVYTLDGPRRKGIPSLQLTAAINLSDLSEAEASLQTAGFYKTDDIFE
jgi:hypothetical protein